MMGSELETVEPRLKSFMIQLQTECGILERLVYKHKNQHRRCSYFQYIMKVRRDLKLLKLANLEEIVDASFLVINGNRPKQKVQFLESLKRRRCNSDKFNFLERLHGASRLLSQMVEPILKASMEISTLLAQSFFIKFSLTIMAVLARIRVLVQQILLDVVHVYNTVSSLSQKEQTVKLSQEGFEVFREYYPRKEETIVILECIWQSDKCELVERTHTNETKSQEKDDLEDVSPKASNILYENIEVLLGADESGTTIDENVSLTVNNTKQNGSDSVVNNDEKQQIPGSSVTAIDLTANIVSQEDDVLNNLSDEMDAETSIEDSCIAISSTSYKTPMKHKNETKMKVAFVSVKPPKPSTSNQSK